MSFLCHVLVSRRRILSFSNIVLSLMASVFSISLMLKFSYDSGDAMSLRRISVRIHEVSLLGLSVNSRNSEASLWRESNTLLSETSSRSSRRFCLGIDPAS